MRMPKLCDCLLGSVVTFGNIVYVCLFGWWTSLIYFLLCPVMYLTIFGAPYGMYFKELHHLDHCPLYLNVEH